MRHTLEVGFEAALCERFQSDGYAVVAQVIRPPEVEEVLAKTEFEVIGSTHKRGSSAYANRQALSQDVVKKLAQHPGVKGLAELILGSSAFAVRAILFDKVSGANWKVPWHQDLTIAVRKRIDIAGYGPWSEKEGIPHVQPPSSVLEKMIAVRVHLDDCGSFNGPLRVLAGTHRDGRLSEDQVDSLVKTERAVELTCKQGDAILMSPLTIHASSPAESPQHRRVVHIEYAACELHRPLEWAHRVS